MERKFTKVVPRRTKQKRLDLYLLDIIKKGVSRNTVHRLISEGNITVNGLPAKAHHLVRPGEVIEITLPEPEKLSVAPEDIPLDIFFEDDALLVINKPAGMVVHPAAGNTSGTLVNALLHHCDRLSSLGGPLRPGIVHRLDKDTSGLLVVAKTDSAHLNLARQIQFRTVKRQYLAIVWGTFETTWGRIEAPIGRDLVDRKRMAVAPIYGRVAATNFDVLENFGLCSYISLELETGRTHQIRVHLAHIGHPVFGDSQYRGRRKRLGGLTPKKREEATELLKLMRRQALHAAGLGFVHPETGKRMDFCSDLPDDMARLLATLRAG
ncbi:MAG: RluA family pseudouridine synthase [bacterium]